MGRVAAVLLVALAASPAAAQVAPGTWFEYELSRSTGSGRGEYEGYRDWLNASGTYRILGSDGAAADLHAIYSWSYVDDGGRTDSGSEDRQVRFRLADRVYLTQTDLDEFDTRDPATLAVWFWVPPGLAAGQRVQIADDSFTVTGTDAVFWDGWVPRRAVELVTTGTDQRNDTYGTFSIRYRETYRFDPSTGFVLSLDHHEEDDGQYQGRWAAFSQTEVLTVTRASYQAPLHPGAALRAYGAGSAGALGSLFALVLFVRWLRRRPRTVWSEALGAVQVRRLRRLDDLPEGEAVSPHFDPFLEDFANKALLAGDPVVFATSAGRLVALALRDREADIGTILGGRDVALTESLRRMVRARDFFTDTRAEIPEPVRTRAASVGRPVPRFHYNVFETYQVLALDAPSSGPWDTTLVRRMKDADLPDVLSLAERVHGLASPRWLRAQLASGDVGFVARQGAALLGFAFATFANGYGRVHTNTVHADHRNQGIGKELMRARLKTLSDLGARRVVTEIAHWNLASLQVAVSHGFRPVAALWVETTRRARIQKTIVRR